jgi:uncharacterized protein (TIGR02246 family)
MRYASISLNHFVNIAHADNRRIRRSPECHKDDYPKPATTRFSRASGERSRTLMNTDEAAIADVLVRYNKALNASDLDAVVQIYSPAGVFMPQGSPSSVGIEAVRAAYKRVFDAITLLVQFDIAEVHQVAPDWGFVRTNSSGTQRINASGSVTAERNQELFLMSKTNGDWQIARYCFSTTMGPSS